MVCVSRHVEASSSILSSTTDGTPHHPPEREINVNGTAFLSTKNVDAICVTYPITGRTITCNKYLCGEGYDSDGDIVPSFDAVLYEEYI